MNAQQMAVVLTVAAAVLWIVALAVDVPWLLLPSVPFSVAAFYCTFRDDWE